MVANNIKNSFKELIERPKEGFIHGPLEGFTGLAKGSGSVVTTTVGGAFNMISKVTDTMA